MGRKEKKEKERSGRPSSAPSRAPPAGHEQRSPALALSPGGAEVGRGHRQVLERESSTLREGRADGRLAPRRAHNLPFARVCLVFGWFLLGLVVFQRALRGSCAGCPSISPAPAHTSAFSWRLAPFRGSPTSVRARVCAELAVQSLQGLEGAW